MYRQVNHRNYLFSVPTDTQTSLEICTHVQIRAYLSFCANCLHTEDNFISRLLISKGTVSNCDLNLLAVACMCIIKKKQNRLLNKRKPRSKWVTNRTDIISDTMYFVCTRRDMYAQLVRAYENSSSD